MKFSNFPSITLHVEKQDGAIVSSRLSLSDAFQCIGLELEELFFHLQNPLAIPPSTPFQTAILSTLQKIPFGQTISYSELAALAGYPKAARAVGNACHHNPLPFFIPCHRVVAAHRKLGGFAYDLEIKRRLLQWEKTLKS